jgi:hypothetical protein
MSYCPVYVRRVELVGLIALPPDWLQRMPPYGWKYTSCTQALVCDVID